MNENTEKVNFLKKINPLWIVVFLLLVLVWQNRWKVVVAGGGETGVSAYKLDTFTGNVYYTFRRNAWSKIEKE